MSNLAGLGVALLTVLAICCLWLVIKAMFWLADSLQDVVFDRNAHILWRILFVIPWLVFRLFTVVFLVLGLLCGISIAKDTIKWFSK